MRVPETDLDAEIAGGAGRDAVSPRGGDPTSRALGALQFVVEHVTAMIQRLTANIVD
ncbi:hypothetical protein [Streptomyces sp.]|uniref:hypothetical protein n=1 Tax=Streptomyces sp. TaxID=1931 RepID=UPI00281195CB|nr:hypothetical protein [Streptomyces sp.]